MVLEEPQIIHYMLQSIKEDLFRYVGKYSTKKFFKSYFSNPGFRYMVWIRLGKHYKDNKILLLFIRLIHRKLTYKFGIQIPISTDIGRGFYIGHFNEIIVNGGGKIGDNVNISQGVTIGQVNIGEKKGVPIIGNEVYIGPGAKIIGKIVIGNNVAIGANAVVTSDIPENSVAAGVPARVISDKGSEGYVNRKV